MAYSSTLKMGVIWSSETLGALPTTRHYNPEDNFIYLYLVYYNSFSSSIIIELFSRYLFSHVGFEVFTSVTLKNAVF
jgi:hypothetical protein